MHSDTGRYSTLLLLARMLLQGPQILYAGEVVGRLLVSSMPAGGYLVTSAEWGYPARYQADAAE